MDDLNGFRLFAEILVRPRLSFWVGGSLPRSNKEKLCLHVTKRFVPRFANP